jgi:hypothetical protein
MLLRLGWEGITTGGELPLLSDRYLNRAGAVVDHASSALD